MHLVTQSDPPPEHLVESFGPAIAAKLWDDFKRGNNLRLAKAIREQQEVGKENAAVAHRSVDGMGQVMCRMSQSLKYAIIELYGHDALEDRDFMRKLDSDNHLGLKPAYERKAAIIHPGLPSGA